MRPDYHSGGECSKQALVRPLIRVEDIVMSHLYLLRVDIIASTSLDRDEGHGIVLPNP